MSKPMLEVRSLNAFYGKAQMLFDVSLEVGRGEVVALMGRNGAGKSTTIKSIMGLLQSKRGQVRFLGEDIAALEPYQIARRGLGFVPEDRRVFSELSVMQNLEVGRQAARAHARGRPGGGRTARTAAESPRAGPRRRRTRAGCGRLPIHSVCGLRARAVRRPSPCDRFLRRSSRNWPGS